MSFNLLVLFTSLKPDHSNLVANLTTKTIDRNRQGNPVLKYSIQPNYFDTVYDVSEMDGETLTHGTDFDETDNMGGSSQVEFYLSQHRQEDDNDVVNGT